MNDDYLLRFAGIGRLYGTAALQAFANAHVCVIGIGGVGSWAAEALARSGIGAITLIDLDDICISNSNRQIHALSATIGKDKVEVMADTDFANQSSMPSDANRRFCCCRKFI